MGFKEERPLSIDRQQPHGEWFVIHPDGSGLIQLTDNQWEDALPTWQLRYGGPPIILHSRSVAKSESVPVVLQPWRSARPGDNGKTGSSGSSA